MLRKDRVSQRVNEMINLKQNLVPLLDKHISSSLPFSSIKKKEQQVILDKFKQFAITQRKHVELLEELQQQLKENPNHVL